MRSNYNFDAFIYYGIVLDRSAAHEIALKNGYHAIYDFVQSFDLSFQIIGDVRYSNMIVVGKEIHWDYGSYITELDFQENKIDIKSKIYYDDQEHQFNNNLDMSYEDIQLKLKRLGFTDQPKYYIVTNHGKAR